MTPKVKTKTEKKKIGKWDYFKMKNFYILKDTELKSLSHVLLFATPWTVVYQDPQSMGFSRQEYWSGLPFPSPIKTIDHEKAT